MTANPANEGERTTIWQELDSWANDLKPWECFILTKIIHEGRLSAEQVDDAYQHFLAAFRLIEPLPAPPELHSRITGRPDDAAPAPIWLNKIDSLQCINALPEQAELTFDRRLTIVYGRNGAGKSGFVRILTNACFSRNPVSILPNVYQEDSGIEPSANLTFSYGNEVNDEVFVWNESIEHADAKRLSVFDTSVAKTHLAGQTPFEFKPVGFDVFPQMIEVFSALEDRLDTDIRSKARENHFINSFIGDESVVSTAVAELSAGSDLDNLKRLSVYAETEQARLAELDRQIKELQTKSVADALKSLDEAKTSISSLLQKLQTVREPLTLASKERYQKQLLDFIAKTQASKTLGIDSFKVSFFEAIGSTEWKCFLEAAQQLGKAENENYPREQDHCLLCHRPFDEASLALIRRLWTFLESDVQQEVAAASAALDASVKALKGIRADIFSAESVAYKHLTRLDPPLAKEVADIIASIEAGRTSVVTVLEQGAGDIALDEPADLSPKLQILIERIEADQQRLRETDVTKALQELESARVTLRHRHVLSQLIGDIEKFVVDLQWASKASGMPKKFLNTKRITKKETILSELIIGEDYRARLEEECRSLDCNLPIEFKAHGRKGQTLRSLSLGGHKPEKILSEGEQRAVALADFLAEVNLNPASAGIVLDDPVNSQDHERKKLIAGRLVEESRTRQVIVFTHDMVFLTNLLNAVQGTGVTYQTHWVDRDGDGNPGQVALDDCPASMPQYQKVDKAEQTLKYAKSLAGQQRAGAVMHGMAELRRTVEELVPKYLLKEVVTRWSDRVIVTGLKKINWDNDLADEIIAAYEDLSAYIEGHSHTDEQIGAPPEPKDLQTRIETVRQLIKRAKSDRPKPQVSDAA